LNLVTVFRNWIKDDPAAEYPAEANRYHLYVALACPWVKINRLVFVLQKYLF
jgi:glutathionyl-hydroquinone reductase